MQRDLNEWRGRRGVEPWRGDEIDGHDLGGARNQVRRRQGHHTLVGPSHVMRGVEPRLEGKHQQEDRQRGDQPSWPTEANHDQGGEREEQKTQGDGIVVDSGATRHRGGQHRRGARRLVS